MMILALTLTLTLTLILIQLRHERLELIMQSLHLHFMRMSDLCRLSFLRRDLVSPIRQIAPQPLIELRVQRLLFLRTLELLIRLLELLLNTMLLLTQRLSDLQQP